ncbi:MAG: hypothetical protein QXL51_03985 [Candidatus Aenigmatarchaeota archaeon]
MVENVTQIPAPAPIKSAGAQVEKLKKKIRKNIQITTSPNYLEYLKNNVVNYVYRTIEVPDSVKEVLILAADALNELISKAQEFINKVNKAYNKSDIKTFIDSFTKLYAYLNAINALLRLIKKYLVISNALDLFDEVIDKADNVIYKVVEYLDNNVKLNEQEIGKLSKNLAYYNELYNNRALHKSFEDIEQDIEDNVNLKRGVYEVLKETLSISWDHLIDGVFHGSNADDVLAEIEYYILNIEDISFNVIYTYANFIALQIIYKKVLSKYVLTPASEGFESRLEKAIKNASNALDIMISNHYS